MKAIILAGGKGSRLAPYTTVLPKPLMPIGEFPILEVVIRQLHGQGFKEIILAVGHLSHLLKAYFGNGSKYGVKIDYSEEEGPLGTIGPLKQIPDLRETFLLMNGDILTTLDYNKCIAYHKKKKGIMTIATNLRNVDIDFGVPKVNAKNEIVKYDEKPALKYLVSMGIYVLEPKTLKYIKPKEKIDLPDFVNRLIAKKEKVCTYLNDAYWLDIGRHSDYEKAIIDFGKMKDKFLK